jgi:hypothetical protein
MVEKFKTLHEISVWHDISEIDRQHTLLEIQRQKKLPSVEVRLKQLKSTEGFSTCCAIAQRLISTAIDFNRNSGWFQPLQGLISTAAWINIVQ